MKVLRVLLLACSLGVAVMDETLAADPNRPMTTADLFSLKRVADPQISPDGKFVAYQVTDILSVNDNKTQTHLWVAATDGKTPPRQVTSSGKRDAHPRWSPDGKQLLFESNRGGSSQLYILDIAQGGEARKLTDISSGASSGIWSPDGKSIAFVSAVYPEFSELPFAEADKKNKEKADAIEKNPVKARVFTKLFFRHWDSYVEDKRQHLFVIDVDGKNCRNVTPGDRDAYPTSMTFSSSIDFTFTPDSKFLVFTAVPEKNEAWSTNYELCRVGIWNNTGPEALRHATHWETLTKNNPAADSGPQFSPDGKKLAWRAQKRAGYEADKWDILVVDVEPNGKFSGEPKNLTQGDDISVNDYDWYESKTVSLGIAFTSDRYGSVNLYSLDIKTGQIEIKNTKSGTYSQLSFKKDATQEFGVAYIYSTVDSPGEVYFGSGEIPAANISCSNDTALAQIARTRPESVEVPVEGDVKMQMWILKPPGFDESKKWPLIYLVHGGPQGAWNDGWSWRWNPQLWAAQGYVVAMPNPRGSSGFGQKFMDEISGDWGGKCYRDLVAGMEHLEKLPYIDRDRMGTAGASFGGYMQNWFAVNEIAKKFKCQVNHCSVWNFESMWGTTEELWFDEWEHGGLPWEKPGKYREFSPHTRAGELSKYKVPMLIIHNDLDFRCPIGQGHELFASLQRQGVPSRFVNFPDEGHWVLKPANSKYWHDEVFTWLGKYVPPGGK